MQVTKEQIDPCTVSLEIIIDATTVSAGFDRAYKEFGKYTAVPGFRPGKAPRAMLERAVNKEKLNERVMELVAAPAYQEALKSEEVTPLGEPEVEFDDLISGETWKFKAVIPLPPIVKLGSLENIKVERPIYTVTEEDVERQVETLRNEHSRMEKIEGRSVQAGDVLIAEMAITQEGEEPQPMKKNLIRMGDNIPGFDEELIGLEIGGEKEFDLTYPDDHQDADQAGKPAHFHVSLVSINQKVLPELTDEFVASVVPVKTVVELLKVIRENQETSVVDLANRVVEGRIIEEIIDRSELQFPTVLVDEEEREEYDQLGNDLENRKISYEEYLDQVGMTEVEHQTRVRQNATERVKTLLIMRDLAVLNNVEITGNELAAEFSRLAAENQWTEEVTKRIVSDQRRRTQVGNIVVRRKLRDILFAMVEITDVPVVAE